jgi:hypothetical protein
VVADPAATPWMVSFSARGTTVCGGALVAPERVITAAHCVAGRRPDRLRMRLGGGSLRATTVLPPAASVSFPPGFREILPSRSAPRSRAATVGDLAVVSLARPVPGAAVLPIADTPPAAGEATVTYGRGRTRDPEPERDRRSPVSDALLLTRQVAVPPDECGRSYGVLLTPARHLCTLDRDGAGKACAGDSGGPVVVVRDGVEQLVGVVTWGDETKGFGCAGGGFPDVAERALPHLARITAARPPAAPWAHRRVRVRVSGGRARCVIGRWGGGRPAFRIRWFRPGGVHVRGNDILQRPSRPIAGATGTTLGPRRGPVHCAVTATTAGGVVTEESYNGAWPPRRRGPPPGTRPRNVN